MPRTLAIIQARMSSSRLPGKVLLDIAGEPMLLHVVNRTRRAQTLDGVVVATTTYPSDEPVVQLCAERGIPFYRGSLQDVLDRYYQAARRFGAETIVRITADCPLIDPGVIDRTVRAFYGRELQPQDQSLGSAPAQPGQAYDFVANRLPPPFGRTYPIGLDVEVCSFAALEQAWHAADQRYQREHVMPYLYEQRDRFRALLVNHPVDYGALRWTVDTAADLELVRQIFARFLPRTDFTWLEILDLFHREPALAQINAGVRHKGMKE